MKIAINRCFGGFSLSNEALRYLESNHGLRVYKSWDDLKNKRSDGELWAVEDDGLLERMYSNADEFRTDHRVIDAIEKLGAAANGMCASLEIVEIPDDISYSIEDYDGYEHIAETHRTW